MKTNCFSKQTNKENHKLTHKYRYIMKKKIGLFNHLARATHNKQSAKYAFLLLISTNFLIVFSQKKTITIRTHT